MLRGIAQFIANSADTAPVSMMAEQSISASGKVYLQEDDEGSFISLELPFDRAWASLARSIDLSGFEITDRNRSEGRYYIRYIGTEDEKKSSWFGWLGGGDDDEHPAAGIPLLVDMATVEPERMQIRLRPESDPGALSAEQLEALLILIKGNIN
jgi:outer membrane protein assembly factor BamC